MSSLFDFDGLPDAYAVMGNPVAHSMSPAIHAEFAKQTGQRMVYTATQVDEGGLAQAVGNFCSQNGKGLNITVPFKRDAWELVDERSPRAEQAGAVNTMLIKQDGRLYGDNTDGVGMVRDIINNNSCQIGGQRVLLIGAGGAVRGVLGPLIEQAPREIVIANRTVDKAISLANEFTSSTPVTGCGFNDLQGKHFDLIINGTSASLHGELPPLPESIITSESVCYDMMYGSEPTIFMLWAEYNGAAKIVDGLGMLVEQAAESFFLWRGVVPDTAPVIKKLRADISI